MSDFLFSTTKINSNNIINNFKALYNDALPLKWNYFHGNWGSLFVSKNIYNGFEPYQDTEYLAVVIGGPLLMFRNNSFLNDEDSSKGTEAIVERWKKGKIIWHEDLSGPFTVLIINKITKKTICITDMMSFIPVYSYNTREGCFLSTHVDILSKAVKKSNRIDQVSLIDFILNGVITFPFTRYDDIFQLDPASIHKINNYKSYSQNYWVPTEEHKYNSITEAAYNIRKSLKQYIKKITVETNNIAQFISGGEDSRTLSGLLESYPRNAYIFLDGMNREGEIAKKVADIYGANLKLSSRDRFHYLNILPPCSDLVGSGSQYHHAHTYGFHKSCNLNQYDAVFGGLLSDALLKGFRIPKIKESKRFSFLPDIKKNSSNKNINIKNTIFPQEYLVELNKRQNAHLAYISKFREHSAEEWFYLWPISMNSSIPNIHANRRLFKSYEPFIDTNIIKISAAVPQEWKLNRRLFQKTAKPYLKPSKWLFHGDGWLPYFPWYINTFIRFGTWFYRHVAKRTGIIKGNQGPWGEWHKIVHSDEWKREIESRKSIDELPIINNEESLFKLLDQKELTIPQFVNITQALYELDRYKD